jgi:purine-binding chemotaxis protein CheW
MSELQNNQSEYQLVVFDVGHESFGVDIGSVQEIIRMQPITEVPGASQSVVGIINLRGRIIPIVDLRQRFGLGSEATTQSSRIVVVEVQDSTIGMIVGAVSEVLRIPADQVEPPCSLASTSHSDYVRSIAKIDDRLIILLELDRLLGAGLVSSLA